MQQRIYCILLLSTYALFGASEENTLFIKPVPFKDQAHAAAEFVSGLMVGTAGTILLLDSKINDEAAELLFSTVLASTAVLYSSNKRQYTQFVKDHHAIGRSIFFEATKCQDQHKVNDYCVAYANLRKKIDADQFLADDARICDNLLIAANPSLKKLAIKGITAEWHNKFYKNALSSLEGQRFAAGLLWGSCFGFLFFELFVLNAKILFSNSSSSVASTYPMNSVV